MYEYGSRIVAGIPRCSARQGGEAPISEGLSGISGSHTTYGNLVSLKVLVAQFL